MLYTDGVNTLSLFEQPLDGERGLEAQDFREYAVYRKKAQAGGANAAINGYGTVNQRHKMRGNKNGKNNVNSINTVPDLFNCHWDGSFDFG